MSARRIVGWLKRLLGRREHRGVKSFDATIQAAGGVRGRVDVGAKIVPVEKIVGSVSRWQNLRSDFFYRTGKAMTQRFVRIGEAMKEGKTLPPIDVYKVKAPPAAAPDQSPVSEYYVVDGHHRVAMARKLGQDFLDANVIEYKTRPPESADPAKAAPLGDAAPGASGGEPPGTGGPGDETRPAAS